MPRLLRHQEQDNQPWENVTFYFSEQQRLRIEAALIAPSLLLAYYVSMGRHKLHIPQCQGLSRPLFPSGGAGLSLRLQDGGSQVPAESVEIPAELGGSWTQEFLGGKKKQDQSTAAEPVKDVCPVIDVCPPPRSKKYIPPEYLQNHLESRVREIWGSSVSSDWQRTSLADIGLKYRLLAQMAADVDHTVPNNQLHQMKSAGDVLDFYSTPVKDISKLDELGMQELPSNLKINWEYELKQSKY